MIDPSSILWRRYSGNGDIDLSVESPISGKFALAHIRCHFRTIGSSSPTSTTAQLTISLDSDAGVEWDVEIMRQNGIGIAQDLFMRWRNPEEIAGYTFDGLDRLQFAWTNPSSGSIGWGLEIGFLPIL